jgi:hypothetical protein
MGHALLSCVWHRERLFYPAGRRRVIADRPRLGQASRSREQQPDST